MEYICVFEYTCTLHLFSQIYSNLPLYRMKWNIFFSNLLHRLYSNILCKNIVKIFWKFKVGYIQTCTSLESNTMWHSKGGHCSVLSPSKINRSIDTLSECIDIGSWCRKLCLFLKFGIHGGMSVESVIEKVQRIAREKETQKSEHKRRHEEEVKLLKKKNW